MSLKRKFLALPSAVRAKVLECGGSAKFEDLTPGLKYVLPDASFVTVAGFDEEKTWSTIVRPAGAPAVFQVTGKNGGVVNVSIDGMPNQTLEKADFKPGTLFCPAPAGARRKRATRRRRTSKRKSTRKQR